MRNPFRRLTGEQREREGLARIEAQIALDPDMMLITRYTLNELAPEELAAFEERLDRDPAFERRAGLIMAVCSLPPEHDAESDAALSRRAWATFCERVGLPPELLHTQTGAHVGVLPGRVSDPGARLLAERGRDTKRSTGTHGVSELLRHNRTTAPVGPTPNPGRQTAGGKARVLSQLRGGDRERDHGEGDMAGRTGTGEMHGAQPADRYLHAGRWRGV